MSTSADPRSTPEDWTWAYHATDTDLVPSIADAGLWATLHEHAGEDVLFVEPRLEGVLPYVTDGISVLRFKTPGFASTDDGEDVLFPDGAPFVTRGGRPVIPSERLQILDGNKFRWLVSKDDARPAARNPSRDREAASRLARGLSR